MTPFWPPNRAWSESDFEESMPNTHTQTDMHLSLTSRNSLAWTYIHVCAAELATWGVGPDVNKIFWSL